MHWNCPHHELFSILIFVFLTWMLEILSKKTPQFQIFACLKGTTVPFLITVYTCYFSSGCNLTTIMLKWEQLSSFFRGNRCSPRIKWQQLLLLTLYFITKLYLPGAYRLTHCCSPTAWAAFMSLLSKSLNSVSLKILQETDINY